MSEQEMLVLSTKDRDRLKVLHEVKGEHLRQRAAAQQLGISAEAMFDLYGAYRQAGNLSRAEQCVRDGLAASAQIGDRYYLPRDLNALAELEAMQGRSREAEASYRRAEDVRNGDLMRVAQEAGPKVLVTPRSA